MCLYELFFSGRRYWSRVTAGEKRLVVGYLYEFIKGGMRWLMLGLIGQAGLPRSCQRGRQKADIAGI